MPAAAAIAAVAQMLAAVVRPLTRSFVVELQDRAGAEKADAGEQSLQHARHVRGLDARLLRADDHQRDAERHQHVRAQSRRLAVALALVADDGAERERDQQPHGDARELLGIVQVGELVAQRREDRFPHGCAFDRVQAPGATA